MYLLIFQLSLMITKSFYLVFASTLKFNQLSKGRFSKDIQQLRKDQSFHFLFVFQILLQSIYWLLNCNYFDDFIKKSKDFIYFVLKYLNFLFMCNMENNPFFFLFFEKLIYFFWFVKKILFIYKSKNMFFYIGTTHIDKKI